VRNADNLPPPCADVKKSGGFNLLKPCGSVQVCNGTAFFTLHISDRSTVHHQQYLSIVYTQ
jgi:hypothetical protein